MPPRNNANKAATSLLRRSCGKPVALDTLGGGIWRTPHLGQISALSLITDPQSAQNFSSTALFGDCTLAGEIGGALGGVAGVTTTGVGEGGGVGATFRIAAATFA